MRTPELCHGIVPVADEDALVELGRTLALGAVPALTRLRQAGGELVQEQAPQRSGVPGVAGKQRSLHRLREVDQRKDRLVEVGEVRPQAFLLSLAEALDGVLHGRLIVAAGS